MPPFCWVSQWSLRLKAETTIGNNIDRMLGMYFGPASSNQTGQGFVLHIRRGVAETIATGSDPAKVAAMSKLWIQMNKPSQSALVYADVAGNDYKFPQVLADLMATGQIKVNGGTNANVGSFFALFDRPPATQPVLAAR